VTEKLDRLVEKYLPERAGKMEYSITEWNSKLPKDKDAYRLFNGLWFSAWIGEMMEAGVASATVWDMFSGTDNGHGMLVQQGDSYEPTGRYWGFWLWSHFMGDDMVYSEPMSDDDLHLYATRDGDVLSVMIMNESRKKSGSLKLDLSGFKVAPKGTEVTLSSREYFWNPIAFKADWNTGPSTVTCDVSDGMEVTVPPYSVKIIQFNEQSCCKTVASAKEKPELQILLPEEGLEDLEIEGWVRAFVKGTDQPYPEDLGKISFDVVGDAEVEIVEPMLAGASARFILKPEGPGNVTVTAECNEASASKQVSFEELKLEKLVAWTFDDGAVAEPIQTWLDYEVVAVKDREGKVLKLNMPGASIAPPKDQMFIIRKYPKHVPKERIGGVCFDMCVPKGFDPDPKKFNLQMILQSENAFWIPTGMLNLGDVEGKWVSFEWEIQDKKFLQAMDKGFSVLFLLTDGRDPEGSILVDNLGFLLRPAKELN
jgi:hypothetical protein